MQLREDLVFQLKTMLNILPKKDLGEVEGSPYKAVTMKRKVCEKLKEANKAHEDKCVKIDETLAEYRKKQQEFEKELNEVESKSEEERKAEMEVFVKEQNLEWAKKMEEFGEVLIYAKGDKEPRTQVLLLRSKESVPFELEDKQLAFVKDLFEKHCLDHFVSEDDVVAVGEALGV